MNEKLNYCVLDNTDFGLIDGLWDKNLSNYFLDDDYWNRIVNSNTFYVLGRKGTGKSALFRWLKNESLKKESIQISNMLFSDFPYEKFLNLADESFAKPNQYQTIWNNILLTELAKLISSEKEVNISCYKFLSSYIKNNFPNTDLIHKEIVEKSRKTELSLDLQLIGAKHTIGKDIKNSETSNSVFNVNSLLEKNIIEFLKTSDKNFYVQIDQLDDNFNFYTDLTNYFQIIVSLFKVAYKINSTFYLAGINCKIILYLRKDIFDYISNIDSESSRWDNNIYELDWRLINDSDYKNNKLLNLINLRFNKSTKIPFEFWKELQNNPLELIFNIKDLKLYTIDKDKNKTYYHSFFKYLAVRTFLRPRDFIMFLIKIQDEARKNKTINARTISDAEKKYSEWLFKELKNEINPQIKSVVDLEKVLAELSHEEFSRQEFENIKQQYESLNSYSTDFILDLLYNIGVVNNYVESSRLERDGSYHTVFSKLKRPNSSIKKESPLILHIGLIKYLNNL